MSNSDPNLPSAIDTRSLSGVAKKLIQCVSDATGMLYQPTHVRRMARAEADASRIKAESSIEIADLQQRGAARLQYEATRQQASIESVTAGALPYLTEGSAKPEDVEPDWLATFFDHCKLVTDEQMQSLWSRILAGEANVPGTFSRHTLRVVGDLEKPDATVFTTLCRFGWTIGRDVCPLVFDTKAEIYVKNGIKFDSLMNLQEAGLVEFDPLATFGRFGFGKIGAIHYHGAPFVAEFAADKDNALNTGHVSLTRAGQQLAHLCGSQPMADFPEYCIQEWAKDGAKVRLLPKQP